jgi:hypothetical protein
VVAAANHPAARVASVVVVSVLLLQAGCKKQTAETGEAPSVDEQVGLDSEGILRRQAQAENLIRDCMKAKGFDYVPVDPVAQRAELVGAAGLTEEEFENQYGYGITTLYEQRREVALGPNEKIRNSLSDPEKAAYDRALYGEDPTATFDVVLDTGDFSRLGGCLREATENVFGGVETLESLQSKLDDLDERILQDPRMVKAIKNWSQCMKKAGYDLEDPEQVDVVLKKKLDAIVGPSERQSTPGSEPPPYDRQALAALQREEVAMVRADVACEKSEIAPVEEKVRPEFEREFREKNAGLLKEIPAP